MPLYRLIEGYRNFHRSYFGKDRSLYKKLALQGQAPETLVIACSDSRIDPAIITASKPGDLFVVRNVAAIVPPYESDGHYHGTSAAIEFAVKILKVRHVIVMGHGLCGGAQALTHREKINEHYDFIGPWIDIGKDTLKAVLNTFPTAEEHEKQKFLEQALVLTSLKNLMTFPWLAKEIESGHLKMHGWYFDFQKGALQEYNPSTRKFQDILENATERSGVAGKTPPVPCCSTSHISDFLHAQAETIRKTGT